MPFENREVWLRGALPDVHPLLQPVAHALMQAREEVNKLMTNYPDELLWQRPAGRAGRPLASAGFHLQHLTGVLDRTFTYARGESLTTDQLDALMAEGQPVSKNGELVSTALVRRFAEQVDRALAQLRNTDPVTLTDGRGVGRAQLPSTVLGLYVHAAEHTMRHLGQLLVTAQVVAP